MQAPTACRVCNGQLELAQLGSGSEHRPSAFRPSCHLVGEHGDLYRCRDCGTVHQPSLPSGRALQDLYRGMSDDRYLTEEDGRRRTARRLLDLLAAHVPRGRLLEVGCGHGLLLDEARRRGYEVEGLELSVDAARHAREALGLPVRELALEDVSLSGERYDALLLVDVLEHLSDPVDALARSCALLAPAGALLIATPDPSSLVARVAGRRWWSYLPAHFCLIPRLTLRELIYAQGLVMAEDVPYVASFTLRYWLAGLAERGGWAAGAIAKLAGGIPRTVRLTASLRDEHVLLARRVERRTLGGPRNHTRDPAKRIAVVVPTHNDSGMVARAAAEHAAETFDRVLLVDDASSDDTVAVALECGLEALVHPVRCGSGASQKTGCVRALLDGADVVVVIPGENAWDCALVERMAGPILAGVADVVTGLPRPSAERIGNSVMRWAASRILGLARSRYATGYRAFSADLLRSVAFLRNSDESAFDQEILAQIAASGARMLEVPIPARLLTRPSPSSRSLAGSVVGAAKMLTMLVRVRADRRSGRWLVLRPPAVDLRPSTEAPDG